MADFYRESDAAAELFFYLISATTALPITGETGQPQVRKQGGSWVTSGVGSLAESGNGYYRCAVDLTNGTLATVVGDLIDGRVKTTNAAEAPSLNEIQVIDDLAHQRLIEGAASIILGPVVGGLTVSNFIGEPQRLAMFQGEAKTFLLTVLDPAGAPVNLVPFNLRFVVESLAEPRSAQFTRLESSGHITVSGAGNNIANVSVTGTNSAISAIKYEWRLWDDAGDQVLMYGDFHVIPTSDV